MSDDDSIFGPLFSELGRNRALDEQVEHPGRNTFRPLPKRFYKEAKAAPLDDGFTVLLDGRAVKTPAKSSLKVPTLALAEAMAGEWEGQGEKIDPRTMWLTKLANTAIDRVAPRRDEVIADIMAFAGTDLICYRADNPAELARRHIAYWQPLVDWAADTFGARLRVTEGLTHIAQDEDALAALRSALTGIGSFSLAALHNATTLTGSAIIGLALLKGRLDVGQAFDASHVDEAWQAELCGEDEDEALRLATRREELADTARFFALLGQTSV